MNTSESVKNEQVNRFDNHSLSNTHDSVKKKIESPITLNSHLSQSSKNSHAIEFSNVNIGYPGHLVLQNLNFIIKEGEYVGIIGPNGSGKTTLLKTLLHLIKPIAGTIQIYGKPIDNRIRNSIGYVPQSSPIPREFPLSVKEAVLMGRYGQIGLFHRPKKIDHEMVHNALIQVHLHEFANRPIGHLSGGEQQKILIARALARNPKILLLDEPTSALDFEMTRSVFSLVDELHKKYGLTILMVHHNVNLIRKHCDRLFVLDQMIRFDGHPTDPRVEQAISIAYNLFEP
ncbi:MAG: ABC transporter ATP-binding protein [Candidatus Lokiarchaeota archaeon]|nr:ABC transporter ATP-binding protein [Candidatus Harpocratesius repetitus]